MTSGLSTEGRALKVLKIGSEGRGQRKPAIWIDGGMHCKRFCKFAPKKFDVGQKKFNM